MRMRAFWVHVLTNILLTYLFSCLDYFAGLYTEFRWLLIQFLTQRTADINSGPYIVATIRGIISVLMTGVNL